jgi:uncharacterized hydrophobic protein (TIGR00271 family)
VIIGAMLISPLMGPIMGIGMGVAINDALLLKRALFNYLFAAGVGLAASTIYFSISPLYEAHSEILSRTSPTFYDVFIALLGGLAGILATSSKQKGNVIPGVAIATALMPPLCTAGYGLASLNFEFFFGAAYLFIINTVFIALATLIAARYLKFPYKEHPEKADAVKSKRIIWAVVIITLLPSIYFGYDIVQKSRFRECANKFINNEASFPNNYLLAKTIDAEHKTITLTYGGQFIEEEAINLLKLELPQYDLPPDALEVRTGFGYLPDATKDEQADKLTFTLNEKENRILQLQYQLDSLYRQKELSWQVYKEMKAQEPSIQSCILQQVILNTDTLQNNIWVSLITSDKRIVQKDRDKLADWLKVRLNTKDMIVNFEEELKR